MNGNGMLGSIGIVRFDHSHALDDGHSGIDTTKDGMLAVQPGCRFERDEELGSVGIGTGVGTGDDSGTGVF